MRGIVWILLLAVAAVVAATALGRNDGLVSIAWQGWRVDLSLNLALLLLAALVLLLVAVMQTVSALAGLPERASRWRGLQRERAAEAALREALAESFSGRFSRAHRAAERALALQGGAPALADDRRFTQLARLLAAGSLHRLQDRTRRDALVAAALAAPPRGQGTPVPDDAARLLAAEWALDDRDPARALEMLDALPPGVGRRMHALRLRLQASRLARQPAEALRTARLLANHQAFSPAVARPLLRSLAADWLEHAHDLQQLRRLWAQLEAPDRADAVVVASAARRAVALGGAEDARAWLQPFWDRLPELAREERETIALALAEARDGLPAEWLPRLESAAQSFGHEAAIVVAVGLAFAERQLWGKARPLLEQAAASPTLPARERRLALRRLAVMARDAGDEPQAQAHERSAASLD